MAQKPEVIGLFGVGLLGSAIADRLTASGVPWIGYDPARPDLAPKHVEQIKALTAKGFYDGIIFHRVIDGFMAQTGDPTGTGMGGSDLADVKAEFTEEPFVRGTVGAARSSDPDSANSQFFIMFGETPSLNNQYTVFGEVVDGMAAVDKIKRGDPTNNGKVFQPDSIISMPR